MIHKIDMNGYKIVLDIASGAVHVVDDIVFDLLDYYNEDGECSEELPKLLQNQYEAPNIKEAMAEIDTLKKEDLLFAKELTDIKMASKVPVVKALCLHIAHDCNLKCRYCFAEEGEYHGKRSLMSFEVGKKAIDFIIKNSGSRRNLEVDFFGGEPLMNFEVVKQIVTYGREQEKQFNKNIRFTITTNGVLLTDEVQNYINEHMHNVVLSIDGRKEVNDSNRKRAGGQGSYDVILPKFINMAESRNQDNYYVRGTFTHDNLDFGEDVLHLADLGFKQVSIEPVVADPSMDYAIKESDIVKLCEEYERLAVEMLKREESGKEFNFFHFMIDITGGPCIAKRLTGCGAGTEYLAVTPEGDLYPCHQFVGMPQFKMGDVDTGVTNKEEYEKFNACNVYSKAECSECFAKYYCSGGCAANAYNAHGDILKPYEIGCELQKKRTECAIMMKVHRSTCS